MKRKSLPTTHPRTPLRIFIFLDFRVQIFGIFGFLLGDQGFAFPESHQAACPGCPTENASRCPAASQSASQPGSVQPASQTGSQPANHLPVTQTASELSSKDCQSSSSPPASQPASQPASVQSDRQPARQLFRESHSGACWAYRLSLVCGVGQCPASQGLLQFTDTWDVGYGYCLFFGSAQLHNHQKLRDKRLPDAVPQEIA